MILSVAACCLEGTSIRTVVLHVLKVQYPSAVMRYFPPFGLSLFIQHLLKAKEQMGLNCFNFVARVFGQFVHFLSLNSFHSSLLTENSSDNGISQVVIELEQT